MVSSNRRRLKKPSSGPPALFSILSWIRILCSGCFGKMGRFKRPRGPPPYLQAKPKVKLDLKMGNLTLHNLREDEEEGEAQTQQMKPLAWEIVNQHHDGDGGGDDDDDMFNGLFYVGTKVLTEVEMRSPVEESKAIAGIVKTLKRSNNSSPIVSSRQLDYGLIQACGQQKPDLNIENCAASAAIPATTAAVFATSPSTPDIMTPSPCSKEAKDVINLTSNYVSLHEQRDQAMVGSLLECNMAKHFLKESKNPHELSSKPASHTALHVEKGQTLIDSLPDDNNARSLLKESNGNHKSLHEEKAQASVGFLPGGNHFHGNYTFWHDKKCQAKAGSLPDVRKTTVLIKESKVTHAFAPKEARKHTFLHKEKTQTPVGSLPDCSKSKLFRQERGTKGDGRRQTRSLTDQDFAELRGCIDLGFVFTQDHIPDLRKTLPALEVCYAIAHGAISHVSNSRDSRTLSPGSPPICPWRITSPGDQPQQVKARLRHWAQAVACNVRQAC